jgi:MFS family permease
VQLTKPAGELRSMAAVLAGASVAWGGLSYVTLTIGVLTEGYHFSLSLAALLATVELGAMALTVTTAAYVLRLVPVARLALLGGSVAGAANLLTAFASDPIVVGVLRAIAGAGAGWMAAGLNTSLSRSPDPQRLFIQANFGNIISAAVFFAVMPIIYEHTSFPVYFIAYGAMCLACAALVGWLPDWKPPTAEVEIRSAADTEMGARGGVFLSVCLVWLSYAAVWSLIERFGREIGLTEEAVGRSLGLGTLSGLIGAAAAAWLAGRFRPLWPLIFTCFTTGLCYFWLAFCHDGVVYTWILCVWGVVFCPILTYAFAVGAELDRSGALVRLLSGGIAITTALGPVVGDRLAEVFGYRGMGVATFVASTVACLVLAILRTGRSDRWRRSDERA